MRVVGLVESVEVRRNGAALTADATVPTPDVPEDRTIPKVIPFGGPPAEDAWVLHVDSVVDFDEDGGRILLDEEMYTYAGVDHDAQLLLLAEPLRVPAEVSDRVWELDASGQVEVDWVCHVDTGEGDPIPAEVPTGLRPYFPEGQVLAGHMVEIALVVGEDTEVRTDATVLWQAVTRPSQHATFNSELILTDEDGNLSAGVDPDGNLSGGDVSYTGTFNADTISMLWDGVPAVEILDLLPRGVIGWGSRTPAVKGIGTSEYAVLAMTVYVSRDCEATVLLSGAIESASPETRFTVRVRHTFNPDDTPDPATNTSPILASPFDGSGFVVSRQQTSGAASADNSFHLSMGTQLAAGWYNLRVTIQSYSGALNTVGEFTAHFMDQGPVLLANAADAPPAPGTLASGGTDTGAPTNSEPSYFTRTYDATHSKWWSGGGTFKGDGDNQYFGNSSGTGEGNRKSVIWFNKAAIVRDHDGRTIDKVELYLYLHNGGSDNVVAVGSHKDTSPGSNAYGSVDGVNRQRQTFGGWNSGQGRWVEITFDRQDWNVNGQIAGVVIGPESNNTDRYAGGYHGATHNKGPRLRITSIG